MGKINAYDIIMIENKKKRENMEIKEIILHKSPSKRSFTYENHSLLKQVDSRESVEIIMRYPYM